MSIRTWEAAQSAQMEIGDEVYPVVTQEDLARAVMDGVVALDRLGGCLLVALTRVPTGIPNEMVTHRALVTWQDRTNAKPQPERGVIEDAPAQPLSPEQEQQLRRVMEDVEKEDGDGGRMLDKAEAAPLDDGLSVDPDEVDESDPELQAVTGG